MKSDMLLRAQLLHILDRNPGIHGYAAHKQLVALYSPAGSDVMYRALRALETEGLVVSKHVRSGHGPQRRAYEVTDAGRAQLAELVAEIERTAARLTDFVRSAA